MSVTPACWFVTLPSRLTECGGILSRIAAAAVLAMLAVVPTNLRAQEETVVPSEVSCAACRIHLQPEVSLGDPEGPGMLEASLNGVVGDSHGRYVVRGGQRPYFWVFDEAGNIVVRMGHAGQGPGEFLRIIAAAVGPDDSIYAFDSRQSRMTVFSSDLQLVGSRSLAFNPNLPGAAWVGNRLVVNADIASESLAGLPIHVLDEDGTLVGSFGSETGVYRPDLAHSYRRVITSSHDDGVWVGYLNQYVIEKWTIDGELTRRLTRDAEWFPTYWVVDIRADLPPQPYTTALMEVDGVLWVLVAVAGENWKGGIEEHPDDARFFRITDYNLYLHTVIEAIDLETGRVLASNRVPYLLWGFVRAGVVYGPGYDAEGNPRVVVRRLGIDDEGQHEGETEP